jgi:hypothetical protein
MAAVIRSRSAVVNLGGSSSRASISSVVRALDQESKGANDARRSLSAVVWDMRRLGNEVGTIGLVFHVAFETASVS